MDFNNVLPTPIVYYRLSKGEEEDKIGRREARAWNSHKNDQRLKLEMSLEDLLVQPLIFPS